MEYNVILPLLLTTLAGLATGIGSTIAFFASRTNTRFLSFSLGLSAGVMIYVSFVEILAKSQEIFTLEYGEKLGFTITSIFFFVGIIFIGIIDRLVPKVNNPHEVKSIESMNIQPTKNTKLMRMGMFTALAIAIHNFPEGIATFTAAVENPTLGIAIAVAVAIHNIPEGIAVSIPIYYATGNKSKAFKYSFLSGLAEPVGALIAWLILMPFMSSFVLGALFASVAGIMVFISLDELLPAAREYAEHHYSILGVVIGMIIMSLSLILIM